MRPLLVADEQRAMEHNTDASGNNRTALSNANTAELTIVVATLVWSRFRARAESARAKPQTTLSLAPSVMSEAAPAAAHNSNRPTHTQSRSSAGGSMLRVEDPDDDDTLGDESLQMRGKRMSVASPMHNTSSSTASAASSSSSTLPSRPPAFASAASLLPAAAHKATSAITTAEEEKSNMVKSRLSQCGLSAEIIDAMRPTVSREHLHAVWSYYPNDKNHAIHPADAGMVATWLFSRIPILFRNMVSRANPGRPKAEIDALVKEHLPHLLPGTSDEIACYFVSSLQLSADGRVAKDELVRCWNRHARLIFPSLSQQKSSVRGAVYCTIL